MNIKEKETLPSTKFGDKCLSKCGYMEKRVERRQKTFAPVTNARVI